MQLVLFPTIQPVSVTQDWWREVIGHDPTESVKRPHEKIEAGDADDILVVLTTDIVKISWTITRRIDVANPPMAVPTFDSFTDSRDRFVRLMRPWVSTQPVPIKRMGFVTNLFQDSQSHVDAYSLLARYLPRVEVDPESFDFTYRVNRRRPSNSGIPDLLINRVSIWSAMKIQSIFGAFSGPGLQHTLLPVSDTHYKAVLNLDINSDSDRVDALPQGNLAELFDELIALATEIATFGDLR